MSAGDRITYRGLLGTIGATDTVQGEPMAYVAFDPSPRVPAHTAVWVPVAQLAEATR